ncbi:hypothetical protein [Streptomyces sp. CL7]|uniref:hypothetical protein n=1 Tax=Streptomyces sp. CL7 TaxID=3096006 RepID=UPI002A759307|nr:hypothetical protein [Streptomyces sp. CL7]WPP30037.1 hypothetical protein SJH97_12125 [Streptomyces sp. CL7]
MAIKRAIAPFTAYIDGMPRVVRAGDLVEETDPVMQGRTHLFETVEDHVAQRQPQRPQVETATAEPGERRDLTPPASGRGKPGSTRGRRGGSK